MMSQPPPASAPAPPPPPPLPAGPPPASDAARAVSPPPVPPTLPPPPAPATAPARGPLDDQLDANAAALRMLRAELGAELPASWDDIWLLRYVLSFPDAGERVEAARKSIKWRAENAAMLADAAAGRPAPHYDAIRPYMVSGFHPPTNALHGEPLFIVRSGVSNPGAVMNMLPHAEVVKYLMFSREESFLKCDAETRKQRRLVKMITMIHMEHATANVDRRFFMCLSESGKIAEFVYPQNLLKSVMFRPPSFFYTLFAFFRPLMTKKQLEKQAMCPGRAAGGIEACPFAKHHFDVKTLPSIVGGECTCDAAGGCICGVSNALTKPNMAPGEKQRGWLW